ncbi:LysR family transcriptional regulator [Thermobifida halotolerans]|uniref:LysR family transcriptional regulator n=1 Tax=Thermobifida halotolerans TaxID=483545 RepID=A0AA97LXC1_9ACTN|nr:LysR substrate-binding domain-containing protein [Thermobifida halotolerans]UOE19824.1 LysR family transcriptional regulator [Thermobifida halotolerans]
MNLSRHLRHFVAVAEEMNFGRAAEALGMAQPPLSQSIRRLEEELGVTLFDRSRRQIRLTTAGTHLLAEARELLAREERLRAVMRRVRDGELGALRLGVPPGTPATALHALLAAVTERVPDLRVELDELTSAEQVRRLTEADLDVGIVQHPVDADSLRLGPVARTPLGAVLPRTSPLARRRELALADLRGHDLVSLPRSAAPAWHDHVLGVCREHGFTPGRVRDAATPEFLFGLVLAGQGVAFTTEAVARREPRVAWRPLTDTPLHHRVSAAWPAASPHPAAPRLAEPVAAALGEERPASPVTPTEAAPLPWTVVYTPPTAP